MTETLPSIPLLLSLAFVIGAVFGAVGRQSNFCTMGAVADLVSMGERSRMQMWALAAASALVGTSLLQWTQLVDPAASLYASSRLNWLSHLLGGLCFGVGMSLASGCTSKALIRLGGGNLKALIVLLVVAISAYMSMRGLFGVWRVRWLDSQYLVLPQSQTLPALLSTNGFSPASALLGSSSLVLGLLLAFVSWPRQALRSAWLASIVVGLCVVAAWFVSGHLGYVSEHPDTLSEAFLTTSSKGPEGLSFVAPTAYGLELLLLWSDQSRVLSFGTASALGVIAGAAAHAFATRSFRLESFRDPADLLRHLAGAMLMGFGGVTALGCSIGQGISGLSTLALGAFLTTAAIIIGCWLSLKLQYRLLMRNAACG